MNILFIIIIFTIILWLNIYNTQKYLEPFGTHEISPHMYLVVLDNHNMDIDVIQQKPNPPYKLYKHPYGLVVGRKHGYPEHNLDNIDTLWKGRGASRHIRWSRSNLIKKKSLSNDIYNDIYIKVICPTQIKDKYRSIAIKDRVKYYSINCYKQI